MDAWQEAEELSKLEYEEIEEERPFGPDWETLKTLNDAGLFQSFVARVDGIMVGYISWMIDFDIESKGTLIANQTQWFVKKGYPKVGIQLFAKALEELDRIGVEFVYLHHTVHGRGARLGKLFTRKGAKLLGCNYVLNMKVRRNGLHGSSDPR